MSTLGMRSSIKNIRFGRTHLFQFSLCFCLHLPDVVHRQVHPLINGAEELTVEVGEDPLLLLRRHNTGGLIHVWRYRKHYFF